MHGGRGGVRLQYVGAPGAPLCDCLCCSHQVRADPASNDPAQHAQILFVTHQPNPRFVPHCPHSLEGSVEVGLSLCIISSLSFACIQDSETLCCSANRVGWVSVFFSFPLTPFFNEGIHLYIILDVVVASMRELSS